MLGVRTAPYAVFNGSTGDVAIGVLREFDVARCIVDRWLVDVDEVPAATSDLGALRLVGRLTENDVERMATKFLVVRDDVLDLPVVGIG